MSEQGSQYDAFADVYDLEYAELGEFDLAFWVEEARRAQPPVLELACGTGRVTLPIAEAGVAIVGVDSSAGMLARARDKVAGRELPVRFVHADMRDLHMDERFGLVMIPFRSFQHLLTTEDQVQALLSVREHLLPGGRLIVDLYVPDLRMMAEYSTTTAGVFKLRREIVQPDSGARIVVWDSRRHNAYAQRSEHRFRYEQLDDDGFVVATRYRDLVLGYIWPREMEHLLARCGFEVEALYGWFDRRPFDAASKEQVWLVRRA